MLEDIRTEARHVDATVNYAVDTGRAPVTDMVDPQNTYMPLEPASVKIMDARPMRSELRLDRQGFILLDHDIGMSRLRKSSELTETCQREMQAFIAELSGADMILPYSPPLIRSSEPSARGNQGASSKAVYTESRLKRPAGAVHSDFTNKSFWQTVGNVLAGAKVASRPYRRIVIYQTWRVLSEPPQDFPLAFVDGQSVTSGNYLTMKSITGYDHAPETEARVWLRGEKDAWYYFSNMRSDEVAVFLGYDTEYNDDLQVPHTAFDCTAACPNAKLRESIEARYLAFWN
jgi:hypothetical protein